MVSLGIQRYHRQWPFNIISGAVTRRCTESIWYENESAGGYTRIDSSLAVTWLEVLLVLSRSADSRRYRRQCGLSIFSLVSPSVEYH
jgi:hypothetical protein